MKDPRRLIRIYTGEDVIPARVANRNETYFDGTTHRQYQGARFWRAGDLKKDGTPSARGTVSGHPIGAYPDHGAKGLRGEYAYFDADREANARQLRARVEVAKEQAKAALAKVAEAEQELLALYRDDMGRALEVFGVDAE